MDLTIWRYAKSEDIASVRSPLSQPCPRNHEKKSGFEKVKIMNNKTSITNRSHIQKAKTVCCESGSRRMKYAGNNANLLYFTSVVSFKIQTGPDRKKFLKQRSGTECHNCEILVSRLLSEEIPRFNGLRGILQKNHDTQKAFLLI